uniref:Uncharacterized protein n=1 Tax=Bellilinea caldifistulae TaxID=360411 RepID=A0A7C4L0Z3_9CHLR
MTNRIPFLAFAMAFAVATPLSADWLVNRPHDQRQSKPPRSLSEAKPIKPGDAWPNDDKFRWLRGELEIPAEIKGQSVNGQCVGLRLNCGDGGEVWLEGQVQARFDNDHPALVLLTSNAVAGARIQVDVQVYGKVQGGDRFGEASLVLIDRQRACDPLTVTVHASRPTGPVPPGLVGLSQGGGMADYDDATAAKLKEGGFKWFRMDNIFTSVLKKMDKAVFAASKAVVDGTFKGGLYVGTLENDGVGIPEFLPGRISDDLKAELEQVKADIIAGKVKTTP